MADEKDVNFKLNLDNKEFIKSGLEANKVIKELGNSESISGLIEGLTNVGLALGTVGVAAYAFKSAIDWTLEAEQIAQVQKSFKILADNAGISSIELKEGMEKAAAGLIDTDDLLKIANEALVKMGSSAEKLPQIMELARKATSVFGGNFKDNFENITNAIANGNTRMLKHYGILVDSKKAVDDFAKAHNLAVNEVSAVGKQQAILNAALEQGKKSFAGVSGDLNQTKDTLEVLKTTMTELKETFVIAFEEAMGPTVRKFLTSVKDVASNVKTMLGGFGTGDAQSQIDGLEDKLSILHSKLSEIQNQSGETGFISKMFHGTKEDQINKINSEIAETARKLEAIQQKSQLAANQEDERLEKTSELKHALSAQEIRDQEIHLQNEIKFQTELARINKDFYMAHMVNVQTFEEIEENIKGQNELSEKQHVLRLEEIDRNKNLTKSQHLRLIAAEEIKYQNEQISLEMKNDALRKQMLTNYVNNSKSSFQGIQRAFEANVKKMKMDQDDFGKKGQETFDSLQRYSTSAFETMGAEMAKGRDIASATADAMKSIFLNMIADQAIASGSRMLLEGIFPPNPVELAAGAGLIALGGALKSVAGSSFSGSTPVQPVSASPLASAGISGVEATGPGDVTSSSSNGGNLETSQLNMSQNQAPQRVVNINIAGNYMETDATRRQLMEMMRQETDATDFTYNKIGV